MVRCTVAALKETADREGIHKTALIVVGNTVAQTGYERSKLYDPAFTTGFRVGREDARGKHKPGTLYVVGMGPGEKKQMTGQALEVMEQCQVIAGYTVYVELVRGLFPHKEFLTTAMTREEERCRKAFDCCMEGKNTAMICSGDAGVYGMAGLILELAEQYPGVSVRTVRESPLLRGGGGSGSPADARFCRHKLKRPAYAPGSHMEPGGGRGPGGFCHMSVQPGQQGTA